MPQQELLLAVIDRIVPADADPGALDLGTDAYVRRRLDAQPALAAEIAAGLGALGDFLALDAAGRDAALRAVESRAWFTALVELVQEGFWADPGNGGNRDALSWRIIGYRHGLPEGPTGPEPR
jgi:hypothetical protein